MEGSILSRYVSGIIPLGIVSALLAVVVVLMIAAGQGASMFGRLHYVLLVINILGIVLLLVLILLNLYQLFAQYRAREMGSRLTLRLLGMFVLLAVIPVSVVFFFSVQALNRGIDSWFDVKIEQAMDDALMLGRTAFDALKKDLVKSSQEMAIELENTPDKLALTTLNYLREQYNASELTLFTQDGTIIASSGQEGLDRESLVPIRPDESIFSQARQGLTYANLDPVGKEELQLRVVVPVYSRDVGAPMRILQVLQPLPNRYAKLADSVQSAFAEYEKLAYLRGPLKFGFILTLSLVALLTLLISVSGAVFAARRLVAPIRDLAEGTAALARGDYHKQLPVPGSDEFGILVSSFNDMTRKVRLAQAQLQHSQLQAELQRTYLETVLTHLSSGVMSFDVRTRLRTYNAAAAHILGADLQSGADRDLDWLAEHTPQLLPFADAVRSAIARGQAEWQAEVVLENQSGRRVLIVRGSALPGGDDQPGGLVVVFDDVTTLIQAQRDAAWGEVARRLAHEIKNPLTPIQLSAERIRHKCVDGLGEAAAATLERSTRTIIDQVEALKTMVNAFSDYARPVRMQRRAVGLNDLIKDVVELYSGVARRGARHRKRMDITLTLDEDLPVLTADPDRLRQVLHNLLLNAQDALAAAARPSLRISTRRVRTGRHEVAELKIQDNGPGFPADMMARLFEPYVTNKEKGTGLGLAIVKKIVEEHNGALWAENLRQGGASITIHLPLGDAAATTGGGARNDSGPVRRAAGRKDA